MTSRQIGDLLRMIADFVGRLTDSEIDALLARTVHLSLSGDIPPSKRRARSKERPRDTAPLIAALREARTRDEAESVLEREEISKSMLERVARELDLPVLRSDSVDRLRQKIVEASVGYRINSEAIQGRVSGMNNLNER